MKERQLRQLQLHLDQPCLRLGECRGRPRRAIPHLLPGPGPLGAWRATESADCISHQQETNKTRQEHIVLHEADHLADHQGASIDEEFPQTTVSDLWLGMVIPALRSTSCEAEPVATIVLGRASVLDRVTRRWASDPSVPRVQTALGDRRGGL